MKINYIIKTGTGTQNEREEMGYKNIPEPEAATNEILINYDYYFIGNHNIKTKKLNKNLYLIETELKTNKPEFKNTFLNSKTKEELIKECINSININLDYITTLREVIIK